MINTFHLENPSLLDDKVSSSKQQLIYFLTL